VPTFPRGHVAPLIREVFDLAVTSDSDHNSGGDTASGEQQNSGAHTAAHRTLPFGTMVQVTNTDNGRSSRSGRPDRVVHAGQIGVPQMTLEVTSLW
jgi:hypothetical protein